MKIKDAYFLKSCVKISDFPRYDYPEFAFFGRSNVGKSSLINMLLGRRDLVKTGSRPGVTKAINFFICNGNLSFADLPGYGYSKLPQELRSSFLPLMKSYIRERQNLRLAFLLVDIRRVPDAFEHDILAFLTKNRIPAAVTLTKCDKLSKNQRMKNIKKIEQALDIEGDNFFFTSAKSGEGKRELLQLVDDFQKRARCD